MERAVIELIGKDAPKLLWDAEKGADLPISDTTIKGTVGYGGWNLLQKLVWNTVNELSKLNTQAGMYEAVVIYGVCDWRSCDGGGTLGATRLGSLVRCCL